MNIYHEKQVGNYCRCHAINNLVGKQLCKLQEFNGLCDEFDKKNGFTIPSSKLKYLFYNNGGINNLFGYILTKKGYTIQMTHYDYYRPKAIKLNTHMNLLGFIIYNRRHTFCIRKIGSDFFVIDSMRPTMQKINPLMYCKRRNLGVICVTSTIT